MNLSVLPLNCRSSLSANSSRERDELDVVDRRCGPAVVVVGLFQDEVLCDPWPAGAKSTGQPCCDEGASYRSSPVKRRLIRPALTKTAYLPFRSRGYESCEQGPVSAGVTAQVVASGAPVPSRACFIRRCCDSVFLKDIRPVLYEHGVAVVRLSSSQVLGQ